MVDIPIESSELCNLLRTGVNLPEEQANQFIMGLFTKREIAELNKRLAVKRAIEKQLAFENAVSFVAVARECGCSEDLVRHLWRDIRDQYPLVPPPADSFCVAVPKEARAFSLVENILLQNGFRIDEKAKAIVDIKNGMPPIAYRVMRGRDMPVYLKAGVVHAGFLGNDKIIEVQSEARENGNDPVKLDIKKQFFINAFRMCIAVPKDSAICNFENLQDKVIATSYASTLKQFLAARNIAAREVAYMAGGVEEACRILGADAIMDIVETGGSLRRNNLVALGEPVYKGDMSFMALSEAPRSTMLDRFSERLETREQPLCAA